MLTRWINLQSALNAELVVCETVINWSWVIGTEGSQKKYKKYSVQATKSLSLGFYHAPKSKIS